MARLEIVIGHKNINDIDRPLKKKNKGRAVVFLHYMKDRKTF